MDKNYFGIDLIYQVYVGNKSKEKIYQALQIFLPNYTKLNLDYACKFEDENYIFQSEDEMIDYFITTLNIDQDFYWCQFENNPDKIMLGAHMTSDDKLIISLTLDATLERGEKYFEKLKKVFNSKAGVMTSTNLADYENGQDFIARYMV